MNPLLEALGVVGDVFDTPGSVARGLLSGNAGRAFGGILDPSQRVSGKEMLGQWGLINPEDEGLGGEIAGIGASLATDPLMLLSGLGLLKGAKYLRGGRAGLGAEAAAGQAAGQVAEEVSPLLRAMGTEAPLARVAEEVAPVAREVSPLLQAAEVVPERQLAPTFYSRLEQSAQKMPESVKGESLMNTLGKRGFAQEEAEFTKLGELAQPGQRVGKQDVLKHLDENKIQVEEVWHKNMPQRDQSRLEDLNSMRELTPIEMEEHSVLSKARSAHNRFAKYQTPGGENYRELLLTLPNNPQTAAAKAAVKKQAKELAEEMSGQGLGPGDREWHRRFGELNDATASPPEFLGNHWDEPNVLAHVRMQDRVGAKGEKILHIEEIQSDWHQAGKKSGYLTPEKRAEMEQFGQKYKALDNQRWAVSGEQRERVLAEMHQLGETMRAAEATIPNAPFKDTWHELSMKRMIRYAAENGYDNVTWNTGAAIQKQVGGGLAGQQQFYDQTIPNWVNKYAKKWGVKVEGVALEVKPAALEGIQLPGVSKQFHGFPITPAMREEVLYKGQPLLNLAGPLGGSALLAALMGQES